MATPGQLQMYNKMEIHEMFGLDHRAHDPRIGKIRRIHVYNDEKVPDAMIFKIWLEDHTLGNILRMELLRNENVLFAGYKVPHPLDHMIEMRVQTMSKITPQHALRAAIKNLRGEVRSMLDQFDKGVAALKKGERHRPDDPKGRERTDLSEDDLSSRGGGTDDDAARRGLSGEPMDEDSRFKAELQTLRTLEGFGRQEYSPEYSPESPGARPIPGESPGLTPGQSAGLTPAPGSTPGLTPGPTPGGTPGLTPAPAGDDEMKD